MIEDNQRQLRNTVKDLTMEVKDVVVAFQIKMSELAATMKVMIMAMGNSFQEGKGWCLVVTWKNVSQTLNHMWESGDAQKLENFLFDME